MRVLIVGCGYVGVALGAELTRKGHHVFGLHRSAARDGELQDAGIIPVHADITAPETLPDPGRGYDWVVNCVSAGRGGVEAYESVYFEGSRYLVSWLSKASPQRFLYTSSTSVYGQNGGEWVNEDSPTLPLAAGSRILVKTEEWLLNAAREKGWGAVVFRVAGIYGPGRTYWLDQVKSGAAQFAEEGGRMVNMVHRDDLVRMIIQALEAAAINGVYNVVDDEPVTRSVLVAWLSAKLGKTVERAAASKGPLTRKRGLTNKKVSNQRLKTELPCQFRYPTFREGYSSLIL